MLRVDQARSGVEKRHGAVNSYAHIDVVVFRHGNHVLHVAERIPRREAKHERDGNPFVPQLNDLYNFLIAVHTAHVLIGGFVAIERNVEVFRTMSFQHFVEFLRCQSIRQQGIVRVMHVEPLQDGICFRVQQKFSAFQSHRGARRDTFCAHDAPNVVE